MVSLQPMTRQMCHEFYQGFQNAPMVGHYDGYVYTPALADGYFEKNTVSGKQLFAIPVDGNLTKRRTL